jgi:uncharacterized membrane protein YgcG
MPKSPHIWLHIDSAGCAPEAYIGSVKRLLATFFCLIVSFGALSAHAQQARTYSPAELDAMLAPIALYPDPLLTNILTAALYPYDVKAAADWSAANPNVTGDAALRAVDGELWHPSVKALVAYPDVLARMGESPQWVADLGQAYQNQYPTLAASIQGLRARAQSNGALRSTEQQTVYQQNDAIYVQPAQPNVVYAPYYDPLVVYGTWWWPAIYPVVWRPWVAHPVYVTRIVAPVRIAYPGRVWHPAHVHPSYARPMPMPANTIRQPVGQIKPMGQAPMPTPRAMSPRPQQSQQPRQAYQQQTYHAVPESRRAPIVQSHTAPMPQMRGNASTGGSSGLRGGHSGGGHSSGGGHGGGHGGGRRG